MRYGKKTIDDIEVYTKADGKFPVIALIGSTRFKEMYFKKAAQFQSEGYIVLMTSTFFNAKFSDNETILMQQAFQRIDMADEVYVINPYDYIGSNTLEELKYTKENNKPIRFLTQTHFVEFIDDDSSEEENNE